MNTIVAEALTQVGPSGAHGNGAVGRVPADILARSIYEDLRAGGLSEQDVMALAGELLSLVADDIHGQPSST